MVEEVVMVAGVRLQVTAAVIRPRVADRRTVAEDLLTAAVAGVAVASMGSNTTLDSYPE